MTPLGWTVLCGCLCSVMALAFKGLQRSGAGLRHCYLFVGGVGAVFGWALLLAQREPVNAASALFGVGAGLLFIPGAALAFASLREVPISVAWTALALGVVVPVTVGLVALGETMSGLKAGGFALSLATIGLFGLGLRGGPKAGHVRLSGRGALMCLGMLVLNGSLMAVLKLRDYTLGSAHQGACVAALYSVVCAAALGWLAVARPGTRVLPAKAWLGLVYGASSVLGVTALIRAQALPSYVVFPIANGVQVLAVPVVAYFVFGERLRWPSVVGLGTGLVSMVMLGWGS